MAKNLLVTTNPLKGRFQAPLSDVDAEVAAKALRFHQSIRQYQATPLVNLSRLAAEIGLAGLYLKDESQRFNLNAFKGLGASYALASYLAERLGRNLDQLSFDTLASPAVRQQLASTTFISATAGNYGRALAWVANQLGLNLKIYIPKIASPAKIANIRKEGAECMIIGDNFDQTFAHARADAAQHGWVLLQDTAVEEHDPASLWCMQGYTTAAQEAYEQCRQLGGPPSHLFIQAGAGGFAGAITGFFRSAAAAQPLITIVESDQADAMRRTAAADDGTIHYVRGKLNTISAGLACGEPSTAAWQVLRDNADAFLACDDLITVRGMRILGNPLRGDAQVIAGESGAIGLGALYALMTDGRYAEQRALLQLDANSRVLCFSTEGDTTPDQYRRIVWDGGYCYPK